jgi:predicted DNA binding CopG/RHH family protein
MKSMQITVRNVDPLLKQRINKLAKLKAMSINDFVLDTLRAKVDMKASAEGIDWQRYSGVMGKKSINQAVLDDFEAVDSAMWD